MKTKIFFILLFLFNCGFLTILIAQEPDPFSKIYENIPSDLRKIGEKKDYGKMAATEAFVPDMEEYRKIQRRNKFDKIKNLSKKILSLAAVTLLFGYVFYRFYKLSPYQKI